MSVGIVACACIALAVLCAADALPLWTDDWMQGFHVTPDLTTLLPHFLAYVSSGQFAQDVKTKDMKRIYFFAALLHQKSLFDIRESLFRTAARKSSSDDLRHALLLTLWHVATPTNEFLLQRALTHWTRPKRPLLQVRGALESRTKARKVQSGDSDLMLGLLRATQRRDGVDRLLSVFHATGDRRALRQLCVLAVDTQPKDPSAQQYAAEEVGFLFVEHRDAFDAMYFDLDVNSDVDAMILQFLSKLAQQEP